jgi:hypothetical protein
MKFELTMTEAIEFACCIVDNNLNRNEACDYIRNVVLESNGIPSFNASQIELPIQ